MKNKPNHFVTRTKGQIIPLGLLLTFTMALMWLMLINTGFLIKERIQMQIAADCAAETAVNTRARGLNMIGMLNAWLGTPVIGIGLPQLAWWAAPMHPMDGGVVTQGLDDIKGAMKTLEKMAQAGFKAPGLESLEPVFQLLGRGLSMMIGLAYDTHPQHNPNMAEKQKNFVHLIKDLQVGINRAYGGGWPKTQALLVAQDLGADGMYSPSRSFSLGLKPDNGPIWYLSTIHIYFRGRSLPPAPFTPVDDLDEDDPKTTRWYDQGPDFYRKSQRIYVYRRASSHLNEGFPIGRSLFHISMPDLMAVSAATVYNPGGPMFPRQGQGLPLAEGVPALTEYLKADAGWRGQLVPVGATYDH